MSLKLVARATRNRKPLSLALHQLSRRPLSHVAAETQQQEPFIHPTAIVHPNATLGQGVSIGPFCTVGSSAKLGNACKLYPASHIFGHTQLGDNCILMTGSIVGDELPGHTVIGSNNMIGHHAVVGVKCQDLKYKNGDECYLDIGDNNEIREYCSIHRSSKPNDRTVSTVALLWMQKLALLLTCLYIFACPLLQVIGHNNLIMGSCHIAHDCKIGNSTILANNTLLAGHVVVEDYVHTAGATVVHQHCQLGSYCFIGGGSVVSQDVPKFMMVSGDRAELRGLNLEGLKRRGFSVTEIKSLRAAYRKIFMPSSADSGSFEDRLMELLQQEGLGQSPVICSMVQSIRSSFCENRRGICKYRHWSAS